MSAGKITSRYDSGNRGPLATGEVILQSIDSITMLIKQGTWYRIERACWGGGLNTFRTQNLKHAIRNFEAAAARPVGC